MVDRLDELPEVNREQVEGAGKELAGAAVKVLAQGLKMQNREVLLLLMLLFSHELIATRQSVPVTDRRGSSWSGVVESNSASDMHKADYY